MIAKVGFNGVRRMPGNGAKQKQPISDKRPLSGAERKPMPEMAASGPRRNQTLLGAAWRRHWGVRNRSFIWAVTRRVEPKLWRHRADRRPQKTSLPTTKVGEPNTPN